MGAYVLMKHRARASATKTFTLLNWINLVPAHYELIRAHDITMMASEEVIQLNCQFTAILNDFVRFAYIGGTSHQPNYPLWQPLSLVAFTVCWIPHSFQGTAQEGAEWGLIKAINPLFSTAFEATFDKLQLIRTTLISKIIKTL